MWCIYYAYILPRSHIISKEFNILDKYNSKACKNNNNTFKIHLYLKHDKTSFLKYLSWTTPTTLIYTVYPKKYAHGFCFAVLCCGYTLTDFPISIRLTSLALWQSNDFPSASQATLMNMDTYFIWIHYERLHNHNKAKHNKTVCIFLGIYCTTRSRFYWWHLDSITCLYKEAETKWSLLFIPHFRCIFINENFD